MRALILRLWSGEPALAVRRHLRERRWVLLAAALVAIAARFSVPSPPPKTVAGVADMLGAAVGGKVGPDDFIWEERGGFFHDALVGRRVLFLASVEGGPADLYRAEVRLTHDGRPVAVRAVRDLTTTHAGDEKQLVASGHFVAFATRYGGTVQAVSLLDLSGDYGAREARTRSEKVRAGLEAWVATGSVRGLARRDVVFAAPPKEARVEVGEHGVLFSLDGDQRVARLDPATGALEGAVGEPYLPASIAVPHPVTAWADVASAALGEIIGPRSASLARALGRVARGIGAATRRAGAPAPGKGSGAPRQAGAGGWPPALEVAPVARASDDAEGWAPLLADSGGRDAPMLRADVRPDPDDPAALVHLVAIDSRQLDLVPAAGTLRPQPETGARGAGLVPRGAPAIAVLAAGRPERDASAPALGLVENGRVVVPLVAAPTFAIDDDGTPLVARRGPGPGSKAPRSAWQSRAVLVDRGAIAIDNAIANADARRDRGALGVTPEGQWVAAWGRDVRAATLARALLLAHVTFAVHLGDAHDVGVTALHGESPSGPAEGDFFWVGRRETRPPGATAWAPDAAKQPPPSWLPSVHAADVVVLGAQVHLTAFAPGRFDWRMRAGSREIAPKDVELPQKLAPDELGRAAAAIGIGFGKRKGHRGLAFDSTLARPFKEGAGVLAVARPAGTVRVVRSDGFTTIGDEDATELPLDADDGKLLAAATELGSMRPRAGACVLDDGTLVVALSSFDSDEATSRALIDAGCARIVALDRGAHATAFLSRAGGPAAPEARYDTTTLYALERPMQGRVRLE